MSFNNDQLRLSIYEMKSCRFLQTELQKNKLKNQCLDVGYSIQVHKVKVIVLVLSTSIQPKSGGKYAQPRNCPQI